MKVLITNYSLAARGGTELYVRDLALGLLRRGHTPIVYSTHLGAVAKEIRDATIPVVDDLAAISAVPDIIHGHHYHETMTALLRFPGVPAIYVCHDWYSRLDAPPKFPRLLRYVAVDQTCYDKLICEEAIPEERVRLLLNFVDLERFAPRPPLPARPTRALLLCNYARDNAHLAAVRAVCARAGITLDAFGTLLGKPCERPETILGEYDIVLAKGRTALEAMATGAAVILYLGRAVGPMVTAGELERLLPLNFGFRAMSPIFDPAAFADELLAQIKRYDSGDAALVSRRIRAMSGRDRAAVELLSLYEEVIAEHNERRGTPDLNEEGRAAATYLRDLLLDMHKERAAFYESNTYRFTEGLRRLPVIGKLSSGIVRKLAGKKTNGTDT